MIRQERPQDFDQVHRIIQQAFANLPQSDHKEQYLVSRLRKSDDFIPELSLVAEIDGKVVGHILLTRIQIINGDQILPALALAPVSVLPAFQKRGIGAELMNTAHQKAKASGYQSVIVLGHAHYYPRFGYKRADSFGIELPFEAPKEHCFALELVEGALKNVSGTVIYPKEFYD